MTAPRVHRMATLAACAAFLAPADLQAQQPRLCEQVFRDTRTGESATISVLVTSPLPGERFRAFAPDCPSTVEGVASTVGIPARFDFYLALDFSGSTHYPSGVDIDGDGIVSGVTVSPDSIFEAELLAARRFLDALDFRHHRVSLVTFGLAAEVVHPLSDDPQSLRASLDALPAPELTARTNFARAMELILDEHAVAHDPDREQVVLFLSDGAPNVIGGAPEDPIPCTRSPSDCVGIQWAAEAAARGLKVNTFAVGTRASTSALEAMAAVGHGRMEQLDVAGEIIHALPRASHVGIASILVENLSSGASLSVQPGPDGAFLAPMEFAAGENEIRVSVTADQASDWTVSCTSTVEAHCLEISCPDSVLRECEGGGGIVDGFAAWSSDSGVRVACSRSDGVDVPDADAGGVYSLGRTLVSWTFEDEEAGMAACSSFVDVVDTLPPRMAQPEPIIQWACGESLAPPDIRAEDDCDDAPRVDFDEQRVEGDCPDSFELHRSWTVTDASGLTSRASQLVIVSDDSPPELAAAPADERVSCDAVPPVPAVEAIDGCDPSPRLDFAEARIDGSCPGNYTLERSWLSVDRCGNFVNHLQRIEVVDDQPPVILPRGDGPILVEDRSHSFVRIEAGDFAPTVLDGCSDRATWRVAACVSDQDDDALGDGHTSDDCRVDADGQGLLVRAERQGRGATKHRGRSYTVLAVAEDSCGNLSAPTPVVTVLVPHDSSGR